MSFIDLKCSNKVLKSVNKNIISDRLTDVKTLNTILYILLNTPK